MNRQIYDMCYITEDINTHINTLIVFNHADARSFYSVNYLVNSDKNIDSLIIFNYIAEDEDNILKKIERLDKVSNYTIINIEFDETSLITQLKSIKDKLIRKELYIDMSCISIPHLFVLIKLIKSFRTNQLFKLLYTAPSSYHFISDPFTSYKTYEGDIKVNEIIGFSGNSLKVSNSNLVIFMGFEGSLSLKVVEDTGYSNLLLINGSPSYHPKYKDLVVINNYSLINQNKGKINYAPANNPYEVYNFLETINVKTKGICIAPLSTKPAALGICLYALQNPDTRIIYPSAESSKKVNTINVDKTMVYSIIL